MMDINTIIYLFADLLMYSYVPVYLDQDYLLIILLSSYP